ncbi:MAG: 4Fe-4S binding protein [Firmicutes bacterium]|nr:4Fe-4S binding protein [Bacillota bacterium]
MRRVIGGLSGEALKNLFTRTSTVPYPREELHYPAGYRGRVSFDPASCTGCRSCIADCPARAITIVDTGREGKDRYECHLNFGRCVYCGQCADICPGGSLKMTAEPTPPVLSRKELKSVL